MMRIVIMMMSSRVFLDSNYRCCIISMITDIQLSLVQVKRVKHGHTPGLDEQRPSCYSSRPQIVGTTVGCFHPNNRPQSSCVQSLMERTITTITTTTITTRTKWCPSLCPWSLSIFSWKKMCGVKEKDFLQKQQIPGTHCWRQLTLKEWLEWTTTTRTTTTWCPYEGRSLSQHGQKEGLFAGGCSWDTEWFH